MPDLVRFDEVPSPIAGSPVAAASRLDPYFDGLWVQGSTAVWTSRQDLQAQARAGLVHPPSWMMLDRAQAEERVRTAHLRERRLAVLAAAGEWRTCSAEQLAAISGAPGCEQDGNPVVAELFAAGLIDIGTFATPVRASRRAVRARLIRPARTDAFARVLEPSLTYPELVRVTGGAGWRTGGQYDRHNLLATELALRAAEFCEVAAVLGEQHAQVGQLTASGAAAPGKDRLGKAADAVIVRADGARIAVELTASVSPAFESKVARWARVLSEAPWEVSGLLVVFVLAPPPRSADPSGASLSAQVRSAVASAVKAFPGSARDRTAGRIAVAGWQEWFGARGMLDRRFLELAATMPSGPPGSRWEEVSLLDPFSLPFSPAPGHAPLAVRGALPWVAGVPWWLRQGEADCEMWPRVLANYGVRSIPGAATGAVAAGAAGPALPPPRMRAPAGRTKQAAGRIGTSAGSTAARTRE